MHSRKDVLIALENDEISPEEEGFMMGYFDEAVPWMLLFLLGVAFIIPFCLYLIMSWRKHS